MPENIIKINPDRFDSKLALNIWYPHLKIIVIQITGAIVKCSTSMKNGDKSIFVAQITNLPPTEKIVHNTRNSVDLGIYYFLELLPATLILELSRHKLKGAVLKKSTDTFPKGTEILILENNSNVEGNKTSVVNLWIRKLR